MKRLFGGTTLLCAACCAHAGLIRADLGAGFHTGADQPGYGGFSVGYQLNGSDAMSNDSGWDRGEAWPGPVPAANTPALHTQDHAGLLASGASVTGIAFLTGPPAADETPIPDPATLALFGLGASALGLARQGKRA